MEYTLLEQIKIRLRQFHTEDVWDNKLDSDGNPEIDLDGNPIMEVVGTKVVWDEESENPILEQLIEEAWRDIRTFRQYPKTWDEEKITDDLSKYNNIVIKLVMYDYIKEGADFEKSNNENGETRTYINRETILNDIVPLVTVL